MKSEIERKFLVTQEPPDLSRYPKYVINQGYIVITDELEVRLRQKGERYYITVKRGEGLRREEAEAELSVAQFDALWPLTVGKRVEKTRYEFPCGDNTMELDVYSGALGGLIVAEVEFKSEEESASFNPPAWLGKEVTENVKYKNKSLALRGLPSEMSS